MKLFTTLLGLLLLTHAAKAGRTSASYSIPVDSTDAAGARVQSANYSINGSGVGEPGAGANPVTTSAAYNSKAGYVGGLYDVIALSVTAPPSSNLNENTTRQLAAAPLADDGSTLAALIPTAVSWSVNNGPITSISSSGLATAGVVYQDTAAAIGATAQSLVGQLNLMILNVTTDDFGAYAGDGIDDAWQVQYFGQPPNPLAGANVDADGTGQTNLFKFVAGLNPLDYSRFTMSVVSVPGQPGQKNLVFSPLASGRAYTPQFKTSLTNPTWQPLTTTMPIDNGTQRTVTDPNAAPAPKYYRVQISKP